MPREPFSPPAIDVGQAIVQGPTLPARARGEYSPWQPGQPSGPAPDSTPGSPTPSTSPQAPPEPAGPDPVQLAIEQGLREGLERGYAEGHAKAEAEAAERLEALQTSLTELLGLREVLAEVYRHEMVEVALATAEALVQADLSEHRDRIQPLLEQALQQLGDRDDLKLVLHPEDAEATRTWLESLEQPLTLKTDPTLCRGDFKLASRAGSVESLMRERVDRVRQLVLGELAAQDEDR